MPVFQTAITGTPFNSGSTPTSYSGLTISCLPSRTNTFYVNVYQTTSKTITVKSNAHWLHIDSSLSYVGTNYTSFLCTYINDYNSVVDTRTGTISITATGLSTTWTVTQNGITANLMTETEFTDYLVNAIMTGVASTSGVSGTSGTSSNGSSGTSSNGSSGTSGSSGENI